MSTGKLLSNLTKCKNISCIKQAFHFEGETLLSTTSCSENLE